MATKKNTFTENDRSLDDSKETTKVKAKQRKKDSSSSAKRQPKKQCRKIKEYEENAHQKQRGRCLVSSPSTLEENEVFGQPIPELYPELSEDFERPVDTNMADENNDQQETQASSGLDKKEHLDDSPYSSEDSQPIGIKKRRKMLIPKKFKRQFENLDLDSDDEDEFSVPNPCNEPDNKQEDDGSSEKQAQRTGSWVQCSLIHCGKWRCLNDTIDPTTLPDKWVCSMNPDCRYNRCQASQEAFDSQDEDFDVVYSPYPEGAIVWAKLAGYPWWPGMMENDPDYGYYCEKDEETREPISYHVVFFDKDVSRAWVSTCNVRLFQVDDNPEDQGSVVIRKKNFKKKLDLATEQAKQALSLPPEKRLDSYGFASRFKGPIGHQNKSTKAKKTKLEVIEEEDIEEEEEKDEEEDYVNSAESIEFSESSENFSEEFCKKTKKKTPTKKTKKATNTEPTNKMTKQAQKKEKKKDEKIDESKVVKSTADKAKKNTKPRKNSIDKKEKGAEIKNTVKTNKTQKGKKIQEDTPVVLKMNAFPEDTKTHKDLVTSPTKSESPKSPIPSAHEGEMPAHFLCDVSKETSTDEKPKTTNNKKRKLGDKKVDGQGKKKTSRKQQTKKAPFSHPVNNPVKQMKDQAKTKDLVAQVENIPEGLKKSPEEEESRKEVSDKTAKEDGQVPEAPEVQPSSSSSPLQYTNMPKLIKASFKPPSKKSSGNNPSCPKPTKMPKLWRPQFVCPAAAAAEQANNLLNGNKTEQNKNVRKRAQSNKVELKQSDYDDQERCSTAGKKPLLQGKAVQKDQDMSDEVEVELAKLDRDIEDMKREFGSSVHSNEKEQVPLQGDNISREDSPEF